MVNKSSSVEYYAGEIGPMDGGEIRIDAKGRPVTTCYRCPHVERDDHAKGTFLLGHLYSFMLPRSGNWEVGKLIDVQGDTLTFQNVSIARNSKIF